MVMMVCHDTNVYELCSRKQKALLLHMFFVVVFFDDYVRFPANKCCLCSHRLPDTCLVRDLKHGFLK